MKNNSAAITSLGQISNKNRLQNQKIDTSRAGKAKFIESDYVEVDE